MGLTRKRKSESLFRPLIKREKDIDINIINAIFLEANGSRYSV